MVDLSIEIVSFPMKNCDLNPRNRGFLIKNGDLNHRNSEFSQLSNGDLDHSFANVFESGQ